MKKVLVISAYHKGKDSLGESLLNGIDEPNLEIINLYENPLGFYKGEKELSIGAKEIFNKLESYDNWVFLYPVWWSNMPGILKNFFDWAILYGLIYDGKSVPEAALEDKNKRAVIVCSSGDVYGKEQSNVTNLIENEILQYWGAKTLGSLFIEDTYNFTDDKFKSYQEKLQELLSKFGT